MLSASDVVIPVRPGEDNEELRHALRSIAAAFPHRGVWLAGHMPGWVRNAGHVPTRQDRSKYENSLKNLLSACMAEGVSEEFTLWNDDMFLLRPAAELPVLHAGTMRQFVHEHRHLGLSSYMRGVRRTHDILKLMGHPDPLCYELHVPMAMTKSGTIEAWRAATKGGMPKTASLQVRSVYGNHAGAGGERAEDVKVYRTDDGWRPGGLFVSTSDRSWEAHPAARHVRELYPDPGPYERG